MSTSYNKVRRNKIYDGKCLFKNISTYKEQSNTFAEHLNTCLNLPLALNYCLNNEQQMLQTYLQL